MMESISEDQDKLHEREPIAKLIGDLLFGPATFITFVATTAVTYILFTQSITAGFTALALLIPATISGGVFISILLSIILTSILLVIYAFTLPIRKAKEIIK